MEMSDWVVRAAGPTTFEGIARSLQSAQGAGPTPDIPGASTPANPTATTGLEAEGTAGPVTASGDGQPKAGAAAERQTEGALESALSRLGGMLESNGPSMHHLCSQYDAPSGTELPTICKLDTVKGCAWLQKLNSANDPSRQMS